MLAYLITCQGVRYYIADINEAIDLMMILRHVTASSVTIRRIFE